MTTPHIDPSLLEEFTRLSREGMSDRQIAEQLGISRGRASRLRTELGLDRHSRSPNKVNRDVARQLYDGGMSPTEIAVYLGCTDATIYNIARSQEWKSLREIVTDRRRMQVLEMVAQGLDAGDIAYKLGLCTRTVNKYIQGESTSTPNP